MTILQKLSDRGSFIYEIVQVILKNMGPLPPHRLQFVLLTCGVYVKKPLLEELIADMKKRGLMADVEPKQKQVIMQPKRPKIITPGEA